MLFIIALNFCVCLLMSASRSLVQSQTIISLNQQKSNLSHSTSNDEFIIRLSGLFRIYNRRSNKTKEVCDKEKILGASVQLQEMILFTIDKINADSSLLPGIKLQLDSYEECNIDTKALREIVVNILPSRIYANSTSKNNTCWGVIGPETSEISVPTAKLLGLFDVPQISYFATSPVLSEKLRFPYFFRTVSSDVYQIKAIIELLEMNNWEYVTFIHENNDYGNAAFEAFDTAIKKTTVCLALEISMQRDPDKNMLLDYLKQINNEKRARVVIAFVEEYNLFALFELIFDNKDLGSFQMIGSDTWTFLSTNFSLYTNRTEVAKAIPDILDGAIAFSPRFPDSKITEDFKRYIRGKTLKDTNIPNPFFDDYLAFINGCVLETFSNNSAHICPERLTLPEDVELTSILGSASISVLVFAYALDAARKDFCHQKMSISSCEKFTKMSGLQLRSYLQNVSLTYNDGEKFEFDTNLDGVAAYNVLRFNKKIMAGWQRIGYFEKGSIILNESLPGHPEQGKGNITSTCKDHCLENEFMMVWEDKTCCWTCYECRPNSIVKWNFSTFQFPPNISYCSDCNEHQYAANTECRAIPDTYLSLKYSLGWCVVFGSCIGLLLTIATTVTYIFAWDTPVIRASGKELSLVILFGLFLVFSVSILFCFEPTTVICTLRRVFLVFCFTLVYASILVKTVRISLIFNNLGKKLIRSYKRFLEPMPQIIITLCFSSVELFFIGIWFFKIPPEVTRKTNATTSEEPRDEFTVLFIDCKGMKSQDLLIGLAYPILLLLTCTIYAIKIRKVPVGFNEAKHIAFVVYTSLVIWLAQLSTYFVLTTTDTVFRDGILCIGLFLNGLIIILALFAPKLYIVWLRPNKNNQDKVMGSTIKRSCSINSVRETIPQRDNPHNSVDDFKHTNTANVDGLRVNQLLQEYKSCPRCGLNLTERHAKTRSLPLGLAQMPKWNENTVDLSRSSYEDARKYSFASASHKLKPQTLSLKHKNKCERATGDLRTDLVKFRRTSEPGGNKACFYSDLSTIKRYKISPRAHVRDYNNHAYAADNRNIRVRCLSNDVESPAFRENGAS